MDFPGPGTHTYWLRSQASTSGLDFGEVNGPVTILKEF